MIPFFVYIRVSTGTQATEGISLPAQEETIRKFADLYKHQIVEVFSDEQSCRNTNRPGFRAMIERLRRGEAKGVICYKFDRLFGNTREAIEYGDEFRRRGIQLVSISEGIDTTAPMGDCIFKLISVLGELRIREISERTKGALAYLKNNGKKYSAVPYGFREVEIGKRPDGRIAYRLEHDKAESLVISTMMDMRAAGKGYYAIAKALNDAKIPTKKSGQSRIRRRGRWAGKPATCSGLWTGATVRRILRRLPESSAATDCPAENDSPTSVRS